MKYLNLFIVVIIFVIPVFAQLQNEKSTTQLAGVPFRIGMSARGISLGNALSAVIDSTSTGYYNPALLPFNRNPNILLSFGILSLNRSYNVAGFSRFVHPNAGFSFFIINTGVSNIDGRDYNGNHTENLSTSENLFGFAFGIQPSPKLSMGFSVKLFYYKLYQSINSKTIGFDIGTLYRLSNNISFAVVVQDINSKYKWDSSKLYGLEGKTYFDRFPLRKKLAASYFSNDYSFLLTAEYEILGSEPFFRSGIEYKPIDFLSLSAGIDEVSFSKSFLPRPSFGISFHTSILSSLTHFQYAYCIERYSPQNIHFLSLIVLL